MNQFALKLLPAYDLEEISKNDGSPESRDGTPLSDQWRLPRKSRWHPAGRLIENGDFPQANSHS